MYTHATLKSAEERQAVQEFHKRLLLPSFGDFIFVIIFLLLVRLAPTYMFGDGGIGWHLATGRYIIEQRSIPYSEFISYTFAGKPWITQYWFSDVLMYVVQQVAGYNGLAVVFAALFGTIFLIVYHQCRQEGLTALPASFLVMVAVCASSVHFLARPLVVTWFMIFWFAVLLENLQNNRLPARNAYLWFFVASLLWSNCHSGYIIGVVQVVIYLGSNALVALLSTDGEARRSGAARAIQLLGVLACVAVGVSVNPYGLSLHKNIMEAVMHKGTIGSIQEFMSPSFHGGIQSDSLEILIGALIASLYLTAAPCSVPRLLTIIGFVHLALFSIRNVPLFAILVAPLVSNLLSRTRFDEMFGAAGHDTTPFLRRALNLFLSFDRKVSQQEVLNGFHLLPALLVAVFFTISLVGGTVMGNKVLSAGFSANEFPTRTLAALKELKLNPKEGFNDANWGGYIFWQTGMPVYIDDRSTHFLDFYVRYGKIVSAFPEWKDLLKQDNINWIIFKKNTDLSNRLASDPEWVILSEDEAAILFGRKGKVNQEKL